KAVQIVLAGLQLDVARLTGEPAAQGVDALMAGFEQVGDRFLRQPVDVEIGMQLAQLARNGDVAAPVTKANRGREIERALASAHRACTVPGGCDAEFAVQEIKDQRVALGWIPSQGIVPSAAYRDEFRAGDLRHGLRASMRLDLVIVPVDQ